MVFIIPGTLSPEKQGYYFTFASLVGLQIFFELGLNQVITQIVSREMGSMDKRDPASSDYHTQRIRCALHAMRKWYRVAAVLFFVSAFFAGVTLFKHDGEIPTSEWLGPWLGLAGFTAINLYFSPMLAVTEGCGHVGQVASLRLRQSVVGYSLTWACLVSGAGLWAIPINAVVASVWTSRWLRRETHVLRMFDDKDGPPPAPLINWRTEVFPFQWRIAVSWMSGYLMYQLFTPLVFMHLGSSTAGQLGLAIAIFTAIQSLGISWFNARIPAMTRLIFQNNRDELNQLFRATFIRATALTLAGCVCVFIIIISLGAFDFRLADRLVNMPTLFVIAIGTLGNTIVYGADTYMRAHGEEPMLPISVTAAVLTLAAAYVCSMAGTFPTMLSQTAITYIVVIPWTLVLFRRYSKGRAR